MKQPFNLDDARRAFDGFERPATYVEQDLYEPERDDYETMLGGLPREQLTVQSFGTVSWGPLCHLTPEAMAYLLPRLMALAASDQQDKFGDRFMMTFINHFSEGPADRRFTLLQPAHRAVVASFLEHLSIEHRELVKQACWDDVLADSIRRWRTGTA